jgi:hypothetical protein
MFKNLKKQQMKTKSLKLAMILMVSIFILDGCKKGENDPLLSMRSRDARITGNWELTSYERTRTTSNNGDQSTRTESFDGKIWTVTNSNGSTSTESYSRELTIEKDGTYSAVVIQDGQTYSETSRWSWLNDAKNKTRILFDDGGVFTIDQLKNSEMILIQEDSSSSSSSNFSSTFSDIKKYTYTKK